MTQIIKIEIKLEEKLQEKEKLALGDLLKRFFINMEVKCDSIHASFSI